MEDSNKKCGNCLLCISTYLGYECGLTDNSVEYTQEACRDYIEQEKDDEGD